MKFITQAAKVLNEQKKYKRRLAVFLCLAVVVALGTAAALKMYGQAMSHKQKKLVCRYAAHAHTDGCFDGEAVVCGYADYAVHLHNDDCYGPNGELVCHLPEAEAHVHTEECYTEQEVLICEEEGAQAHEHTEGCYTPERGDLSCQMEEHMHEDSCYGENGEIICPMEEHQHDDNCYEWKDVLTCTLGGHEHTQDCYTREMRDLSCNLEEHGHGEACYDEHGELACQLEEHTHDDDCYAWEDVLACQLEESDGGHVHGDECYEIQKVLSCGKLELHTHDDSCYDENGALVCGLLQLEEHVHGEDCFETVELTEEEVAEKLGIDDPESVSADEAYSVSGGKAGTVSEDGIESVSSDETGSVSKNEAHVHAEKCYDEDGKLICGYDKTITKTCERERYIVTASYSENAKIPEDAELVAEQITKSDDAEHYAEREAEFQDVLKDENAAMGALFKMGFYVNGKEIEPESPVTITVQFLDENGFKKGRPIKVVHFADQGSEVLDGNASNEGNATFEVSSFSEIAIGNGSGYTEPDKDGKLYVLQSFEYDEGDLFHITFHFDGEALLPQENESAPDITFGDEDTINFSNAPGNSESESNVKDGNVAKEEAGEETSEGTDETAEEEREDEKTGEGDSTDGTEGDGSEEATGEMLQFHAEPLDQESEKYLALTQYVDEVGSDNEELQVEALDYSLFYNGVKLNLENCEVTAEITPTKKLAEQVEKLAESSEDENSIEVVAVGVSQDAQINELASLMLKKNSPQNKIVAALDSNSDEGIAVYSAMGTDIEFTVQYYAYLDTFATADDTELIKDSEAIGLIDTSNGGRIPGKKGLLPENGKVLATKNLYAKKPEGEEVWYDFIHKEDFQKIFQEDVYSFGTHPDLENFNKFAREGFNYELAEIWVLKEGKEATSIQRDDWQIYDEIEKIKFTNRSESVTDQTILITAGTVIRLVGRNNTGTYNYDALFYDYDITDGKLYKDNSGTDAYMDRSVNEVVVQDNGEETTTLVYANTKEEGINSPSNYKGDGTPKYAFGNNNMDTGLGDQELDVGNGVININKANAIPTETLDKDKKIYRKCAFGLVNNQLGSDEYPDFKMDTPNLFRPLTEEELKANKEVKGRKIVEEGFSLDFNRNGDTYTLSSVNGAGANAAGLEKLKNAGTAYGVTENMWQNQFWPMDSASSYGAKGHDLKFGNTKVLNKRKIKEPRTNNTECIGSDDGKDHNSYFGMMFTVEFDLTDDYVGPLNYYFFGDDDMWVFLDGELVCDIGGCHQAVGEYVDLWDWIPKPTGTSNSPVTGPAEENTGVTKHVLKFFYTERGASGSTCWMQFTLPSVSSKPVEYPSGSLKNTLRVGKTVNGDATDGEFAFKISLKYADGTPLRNSYAYQILETVDNPDGSKTETEVGTGSIVHNGKFFLKDGQSIVVRNLPDGAEYTVTEDKYNDYVPEINGTIETDRMAEGTIDWDATESEEWAYVNQSTYKLPETGGPGIHIVYAAVILLAGSAVLLMYRKFKYRREEIGR